LRRQGVGGLGDDDPSDDVGEGTSPSAKYAEGKDEADNGYVPVILNGECGTDSGDNATFAGAHEPSDGRIDVRDDGGSAG
jgi:hypothetical protein